LLLLFGAPGNRHENRRNEESRCPTLHPSAPFM
jgi:hypothetical protein